VDAISNAARMPTIRRRNSSKHDNRPNSLPKARAWQIRRLQRGFLQSCNWSWFMACRTSIRCNLRHHPNVCQQVQGRLRHMGTRRSFAGHAFGHPLHSLRLRARRHGLHDVVRNGCQSHLDQAMRLDQRWFGYRSRCRKRYRQLHFKRS